MTDDKNDPSSPPNKRVVVTYSGVKRKKPDDVPTEITPQSPTHIVSSPVDLGASQANKPQESKIPEKLSPISSSLPPLKGMPQKPYSPSKGAPPLPPAPPPSSSSGNGARKRTGQGMALTLSTVTAAVLVMLLFNIRGFKQDLEALQAQASEDKQTVVVLNSKATQSLDSIHDLHQNYQNEQAKILELKNELQTAQTRLVSLTGSKEWVLTQANYLVFMADERLKLTQDIPTAIAQLQTAAQHLAGLGDPTLIKAKETINQDIQTLSAYPKIDRQKLWEQTHSILTSLDQLKFKTIHLDAAQDASQIDPNLPRWKRALKQNFQRIKRLVKVTREDKNTIPTALALQDKSQVLRTMQLLCEQIQWAILQGKSKVYTATLQELKTNLNQYFEPTPQLIKMTEQITNLQKQPVELATLSIPNSINAMTEVISMRQGISQ